MYEIKAVLKPRVSPAFAITYFCNHCNIRFDPIPAKIWTKGHLPLDDLWLQVCWRHMCTSPMKIHQSMWIQWPFFQKLEPKVTDRYMTFDPKSIEVTCVTLPKDHCNQISWEYIKVCGYRLHTTKYSAYSQKNRHFRVFIMIKIGRTHVFEDRLCSYPSDCWERHQISTSNTKMQANAIFQSFY